MNQIIVTSGEMVPGAKSMQVIGVAKGSTVRSKNFVSDIGAGLKNLVGGEVKAYTQMANAARDEAYNRMVNQAMEMGANAIIGFRYSTSMIMVGAAEMLAYGTAVKVK